MSSDETVTLGAVKRAMGEFARARDWEQFHAPKNLAMAIAAEAGELLEHFLWATPDASIAAMRDDSKRAKAAEELADIILLSAQFANLAGIDIAQAVAAKVKKNEEKYPVEKARGRSNKYTEL